MARRIPLAWSQGEGALETTFEAMAGAWDRERRNELFNHIVESVFPGREKEDMWEYVDRTSDTRDNVTFYQLNVKIHDGPSKWFRNLRLLQLRIKLGLDGMLYIKREWGSCPIGELVAKMNALRAIVGNDRMQEHRIPMMRRPVAQRDFPNLSNFRAEALHRSGVRLRLARGQ